MFQRMLSAAECAASVLFNLPGYRVVEVLRGPEGGRRVIVETLVGEAACPDCGVFTARVHQRTRQRLADVPFDGPVEVVWVKKRWRCAEPLCARATFAEHTEQVPPRARLTTRLKDAIVAAVGGELRAVDRVAGQFAVSWPTVQRLLAAAAADLDARQAHRPSLVRHLGIDEHRFRSVRWYRDDTDRWRRVEPWMTTFVDLDTGTVVGVVDGRNRAAVAGWLAAQPRWWRRRVQVVAIDPAAGFRSAVGHWLPHAKVSVDHFHLVKLANSMLTAVRRRVSWEQHDRRGRKQDPAWAHRLLLMRGYDSLSARGRQRLDAVLDTDDPTGQISCAWGIKEALRRVLASGTIAEARQRKADLFDRFVAMANLPEADRLASTIDAWWPQIETFIDTRVTNGKTEAANVSIKNIKRLGRGYRSHTNYRSRIMLYNATRTAA